MKRKIIISERSETALLKHILNEVSETDINLEVFKYLDDNFLRTSNTDMGEDGSPSTKYSVIWLDQQRNPYKAITLNRLFYIVQDKFKSLCSDKKQRDERIKKIISAWYTKRYNKNTGTILI